MQHIREAFGRLQPEAPPDPLRLAEPEQRGERRSDLGRPGPADLLSVGWHIPGAAHEDTPALVLLSTVLGGWRGFVPFAAGDWRPRSNRLYRALVEAKLATDVGVRLESKLDPSLLITNATLAPGASLDRVEAVLDREIEKLKRAPPPKSELARAHQQVRAWARYEQDGVTFQGMLLSAGEGLGAWDFAETLLAKVEKVRPEQVRAAARRYLVEGIGATLEFRNGDEVLSFQGRCTRETAAETVRILVDCLSEPAFPSKEVERIRAELQNDLRIEADDTHHRAVQEVSRLVFPKDHPYGREPKGDPSRVQRIRRGDIVSFHEAHVGPEGLILAVTGDVDRARIYQGIATPLSRLRGHGGAEAIPPPRPHRPGAVRVPMPPKSQVDIVIGAPGVPRRHEDYYALNLANLLFGRIGLYGRLGRNLRDEQGLAYYAFSNLDARTAAGMWTISAGVNPSNLGKAIESIRAEMDRLRTEPFSLEEVRDGKENQTGSLVVSLEQNAEVAGELHRMEYYGLGMDFLERYADIVRELTEERVRNLARKYFLPSASSIAVAGPIGRLRVPW